MLCIIGACFEVVNFSASKFTIAIYYKTCIISYMWQKSLHCCRQYRCHDNMKKYLLQWINQLFQVSQYQKHWPGLYRFKNQYHIKSCLPILIKSLYEHEKDYPFLFYFFKRKYFIKIFEWTRCNSTEIIYELKKCFLPNTQENNCWIFYHFLFNLFFHWLQYQRIQ